MIISECAGKLAGVGGHQHAAEADGGGVKGQVGEDGSPTVSSSVDAFSG